MSRSHSNILDVTVRTDTRVSWCQYRKKFVCITRRKPATSRSGFCRYTVDKVDLVDNLWILHSNVGKEDTLKIRGLSPKKAPTTISFKEKEKK